MVLDLFAGAQSAGGARRRSGRASATPNRPRGRAGTASRTPQRPQENTSHASPALYNRSMEEGPEDHKLFVNCVSQVQRNLKGHVQSPSTLHTLASYYTKVHPYIEGRPFCVSLSYATFLFHLQMSRISVTDVDLYVQLINNILSQMNEDTQLTHPFVQQVLRDHVFGLPSPTCHGGAHCVVLLPPPQYRGFAELTTSLLAMDVVPLDIVYQFQEKLEQYCGATSPLVANRALALLVQTVTRVRLDEQVTALQYVLKTKPTTMNVDFLLACYERLKRAVVDPGHGPTFGRALAIHCSELFLRFRSPIRREYVERFLYPSLCHPDMASFLEIPATREHLMRELLAQCTPGQSTGSPFYMCLCALLQPCFDDEIDGALEAVAVINCHMPHAAYYLAALAVDTHMSVSMFAKVIIALARGAGLAMTGRDVPDEVATSISQNRTSVYNVLFTIREVVRSCSVTSSRRATDMLKALRVAVPMKTIEALGKLAMEAFQDQCDITVDPQLLCAELAMVLHHEHINEAIQSAVDYFRDVTSQCHYCGMQCSASLLCPVNGTVHITGQTAVSRVLSTLSECAGAKVVEERLIQFLRDPQTQMEPSVHFLIYHILSNAGQHRNAVFVALEPYVRSTLMALVTADRSGGARGLVGSEQKANVLMLHVKLVTLLAGSIDPSYVESIIKVFSELRLRTNHDALALWYMGNLLLRNCKGNVELLPTDPQENNYCVAYPGCAPTSATCADNAQLMLKLLNRAHSFSPEMNKLVGCCVCKMIQDFNMQTPNIVSTLLSSFGFVPVGLESLNRFALPVGPESTFWSFFMNQMKTSAPARTALMAALAKSVARRFRIESPADAITPYGADPTGHLFCVMMFEVMKRSPAITRVVLFMISSWTKQAGHAPGKFVCLVYMCVQLLTVVVERGIGAAAVELEAETVQDQRQFEQSVKKTSKTLEGQRRRLQKLIPVVQRDHNVPFYYLLRRLDRKLQRTVRVVNGEVPVGVYDADAEAEAEVLDDDFPYEAQAEGEAEGSFALHELQQTADDSVFNDYGVADDNDDGYAEEGGRRRRVVPEVVDADENDDDDDTNAVAEDDWTTNYYSSSAGDSHLGQRARRETVAPPTPANDAEALHTVLAELEGNTLPASSNSAQAGGSSSKSGNTTTSSTNNSTVRSILKGSHRQYDAPSSISSHRHQTTTTSTDGGEVTPAHGGAHMKSIGTSPILAQDQTTAKQQKDRSHTIVGQQDAPSRSTDHRPSASAWHEPDLFELLDGDESPIDARGLPALQATSGAAGGAVLPSGMLLEYLRTHQGMDSLRHELLQGEGSGKPFSPEEVARLSREMQAAGVLMQNVAVDARANNYPRPHDHSDRLAPQHTVTVPVRMVNVVDRTPRPHSQPADEGDVVDGERPIRAVSEEVKRRRVEGQSTPPPTAAVAQPAPAQQHRGMNFFLNANAANKSNVDSALQDMQLLQRQRQNMDVLVGDGVREEAVPRVTPNDANLPTERLPPTTPYGQVVLPACLVEQKNDTAIRELRQVMGAHNPNDARLSAAGKRRIRGSGGPRAEGEENGPATGSHNKHNTPKGNERDGSGAWWTEMSSAPMPDYAADPQYSMELF